MSNKNNKEQQLYNGHVRTARYALPFDKAFPGSYFFIYAETSRGLKFSRDQSLYRKGREDEGFYAVSVAEPDRAICLMPEDLVVTVKQQRSGSN